MNEVSPFEVLVFEYAALFEAIDGELVKKRKAHDDIDSEFEARWNGVKTTRAVIRDYRAAGIRADKQAAQNIKALIDAFYEAHKETL